MQSACENLRDIDVAVRIVAHTDADLRPRGAENIALMSAAGHEGGLRLGDGGMVRDIFTGSAEAVAKGLEHVAYRAVGGGGVGKISLVPHVLGFLAGNGAELRIQRQRGQAVGGPIGIHQIPCILLLRTHLFSSIIFIHGRGLGWLAFRLLRGRRCGNAGR